MRTFIVGKRKPVVLGIAQRNAPVQAQHAVVSKRFAGALQGYKSNLAHTGNGTLYALFASAALAVAYQKAHKMQLYTSVVPW